MDWGQNEKSKYWEQTTPESFSVDEKYEMLQYAFPEFQANIVIDVLISRNYDLAEAATVLQSFLQPIGEEEFALIEKPQEKLPTSPTHSKEWVMLADEWEIINSQGDRIPTYSEAVQAPPPR